jgi:acetate---CoA ligase (ADP-forming)
MGEGGLGTGDEFEQAGPPLLCSDIDAIAKALSALSRFAAAHRDQIVTIEANPFLVRPKGRGVVGLDAVVVFR